MTMDDLVDRLNAALPHEHKEQLKKCRQDELVNLHFSLGTWVRNVLVLWGPDIKAAFPDVHADELSGKIIEALWQRLQEQPGYRLSS